jgi:hypothetical protein
MAPRRSHIVATLLALGLAAGTVAQAASVSYTLTRSDRLADGRDYLRVTIADGADGAVDFTVEPLAALIERGGERFEIRAFALNVDPELAVSAANVSGLPEQWSARRTSRMDGFGRFDLTLYGTGPQRRQSLQFSITDVEGDTPWSYALPSNDNASEANALFAARVRGLVAESACDADQRCTPRAIPTAFLGTGTQPVPVPAAGWFILTGALAALRFVRRRGARAWG